MSDTKLFRQAFKDAGFKQRFNELPTVYNDKRKDGTVRLKLAEGSFVFDAPQFAQEELDYRLHIEFGGRYLGGYFIRDYRWFGEGKSFCIVLKGKK